MPNTLNYALTRLQVDFCRHRTPDNVMPARVPTDCSTSTSRKGIAFTTHSRGDLDTIALAVNDRPRNTFGWNTSAAALHNKAVLQRSFKPG